MTHPNEEQLIDSYYSGLSSEVKLHLAVCLECEASYRSISETLDCLRNSSLPHPGTASGSEVWARLSPNLASPSAFPKWLLVPAISFLAAIIFFAGMFTERRQSQPEQPLQTARHTTAETPLQVTMPFQPTNTPRRVHPKSLAKLLPIIKKTEAPAVSDAVQDEKLLALNNKLPENDPATLPALLHVITSNTSDRTKDHALFVLANSDAPEARNALFNLASNSGNARIQTRAVQMIGLFGRDSTVLTTIYRSNQNAQVRQAALDALTVQQNSTALSDLAREETDLAKKAEIFRRLGQLQWRSDKFRK